MNKIAFNELNMNILRSFADDWFLLTAGDFESGDFNMMTIAWGSLGTMWGKPLAMVVVRPNRHTYQFMEKYEHFTVCAFSPIQKNALTICGTKSGRDIDKVKASRLNPVASSKIASPGYAEAELTLQCRKMYFDDFKPDNFVLSEIHDSYAEKDYHRMYFGEILEISGEEKYKRKH